MNGDSYSSRGMASTNALPRIRKHETDTIGAESGRYGSSRDYHVSFRNLLRPISANVDIPVSLQETIDVTETGITIGAVAIGGARDRRAIGGPDVASPT